MFFECFPRELIARDGIPRAASPASMRRLGILVSAIPKNA